MPQLTGLHIYPVKSMYRLTPESAQVEPWGLVGDRRWMLVDEHGSAVTQRKEPALGQYRAMPEPDGTLTVTAPDGARIEIPAPSSTLGDPLVEVHVFSSAFTATEAGKEAQIWFGERLGAVRLVHLDSPAESRPVNPEYGAPGDTVSMADGYPLLLTSTASLADLNALIAADHPGDDQQGAPLPMERFRPNLVVSGSEPWEEDGWRRIRIGEVTFRVVKPCGRCLVTTTDQESGERRGPEPLHALGRHRRFGKQLVFGQNLIPERPGDPDGALIGALHLGDEITVLESVPRPLPDQQG